MATRKVKDELRRTHLDRIADFLREAGEDVQQVKSNEIAYPIVDPDGNEEYISITVKIPTGERGGDPYNPYDLAEDYKLHVAEMAEKAKEAEKKKAAKIERDRQIREAKAKAKRGE